MIITAIYCIRNTANGKVYPGSAVDIRKRWREHKNALKRNEHRSNHLQNSWNKYGEGCFEFSVLEECSKNELLIREQVYLDAVRVRNADGTLGEIDHNLAYNTCPIAGNSLGIKHSEKTKKKISEASKGVPKSEEHKKKMSESKSGEKHPNFGKHLSEETKKKIGAANKGKYHSEEAKKKISDNHADASGIKNPMYGKHLSEEAKKKISGEKSPKAKLTWGIVREIREKYAGGDVTYVQLAEEYGVTKSCIQAIVKNKSWKEEFYNAI